MANQVLSIENLKFRWPNGQRNVLDIANLSLNSGERVFLKGPSGSGKTTLLGLIGGINVPDAGALQILSTDMVSLKQSQRDQFRADHVGFIFQLFNLIPYLSVIENITLSCKFSALRAKRALANSKTLEEEAVRLLAQLQLDSKRLLEKPVVELSVGQQQRVAAARALMGAPELVIADEPTSALDADTREHFLDLLLSECANHQSTVLFVSHDSSLESAFDRSIELSDINAAAKRGEPA